MADNYLQFSEVVARLKKKEEAWLTKQLQPIRVFANKEYPEDAVPAELADTDADWTGVRFLRDKTDHDPDWDALGFEYSFHDDHDKGGWGRHLWVYAEESGCPDNIAWLVQKFLKKFRPNQCWSLTYSTTCSKPRAGEFGGGAVFVTADTIAWQNAYDFVGQEQAVFEARKLALSGTATQTRPIEMYVGVSRGDAGDWYTTIVDIPIKTPDTAIERVAKAVLERNLTESEDLVAFAGVYCTSDDEVPEAGESDGEDKR